MLQQNSGRLSQLALYAKRVFLPGALEYAYECPSPVEGKTEWELIQECNTLIARAIKYGYSEDIVARLEGEYLNIFKRVCQRMALEAVKARGLGRLNHKEWTYLPNEYSCDVDSDVIGSKVRIIPQSASYDKDCKITQFTADEVDLIYRDVGGVRSILPIIVNVKSIFPGAFIDGVEEGDRG